VRIVLSGGWGYGNLGDDAILDASIGLLRDVFPAAEIFVATYDVDDSYSHETSGVTLHRSIHSYAELGAAELSYKKLDKSYPLTRKALLWVKKLFVESPLWCSTRNYAKVGAPAADMIKRADLFVLAGGGYFNENWKSSVIAHAAELEVAARAGVPYCIAGPTIGHFADRSIRAQLAKLFDAATGVYVRDTFSLAELKRLGVSAALIPDIALTRWKARAKRDPVAEGASIGVVVTNQDPRLTEAIASGIAAHARGGLPKRVKLFLSRVWLQDLQVTARLQGIFSAHGLIADLVVPGGFVSLEAGLAECDLVISENLHGMILAARNGVPIVAVNAYKEGSPNHKKIVSFVDQIGSSELVVQGQETSVEVARLLNTAAGEADAFAMRAEALCREVSSQTSAFFAALNKDSTAA